MKNVCQVALKEWAVVVRALGEGQQLLLFRKGGIREKGRDFKVEEREFFLYPTYEHQHAEGLREEFRPWLEGLPAKTPEALSIEYYATVESILQVSSPEVLRLLTAYHIYSEKQILERFRYKPTKPLYVLLLRIFRIPTIRLPNLPTYAGCRSWVPLEGPLSTANATPVLADHLFRDRVEAILKVLPRGVETPGVRRRDG